MTIGEKLIKSSKKEEKSTKELQAEKAERVKIEQDQSKEEKDLEE